MNRRIFFSLLLFLFICKPLSAQEKVAGRIYSSITDSVITGATVYNRTAKKTYNSGSNGSYKIESKEGDVLIFSATGFIPDTVKVQFYMLLIPYDVTLKIKIVTLENVKVKSTYRQDSLERRNYYQEVYKKQPGITGSNRPEDGVGISLSPGSYFSKEAKEERILKKRLIREEREDYIDRSFPAEWVEKLTGLHGDSLSLFIYRYRPSYKFCRKTSHTQMLGYINDKFKQFKKPG